MVFRSEILHGFPLLKHMQIQQKKEAVRWLQWLASPLGRLKRIITACYQVQKSSPDVLSRQTVLHSTLLVVGCMRYSGNSDPDIQYHPFDLVQGTKRVVQKLSALRQICF